MSGTRQAVRADTVEVFSSAEYSHVAQGSYLKCLVGGCFTVSCQKSKGSFKKPHLEGHVRSRPVKSEKLRPENCKCCPRDQQTSQRHMFQAPLQT